MGRCACIENMRLDLLASILCLVAGRDDGSAHLHRKLEVVRGNSGDGLYRDLGGAEVIGVYRWLEDRELGLIVEIRQAEAFSPARQLALHAAGG